MMREKWIQLPRNQRNISLVINHNLSSCLKCFPYVDSHMTTDSFLRMNEKNAIVENEYKKNISFRL